MEPYSRRYGAGDRALMAPRKPGLFAVENVQGKASKSAIGEGEWVEVRTAGEAGTGNGKNWVGLGDSKGPNKLTRIF